MASFTTRAIPVTGVKLVCGRPFYKYIRATSVLLIGVKTNVEMSCGGTISLPGEKGRACLVVYGARCCDYMERDGT